MKADRRSMAARNNALTAAAVLLLVPLAIGAPFFGAIFTTTSGGATVNGNVYEDKADVYLNGGPQNLNANGLPDGRYYFQVTNPSGSVLLSSDDASCRQLEVVGGVVAGPSAAAGSCAHAAGSYNPNNGSTTVQLTPYDDTPNPGGEYKVWLIQQTADTSVDANNPRVLIFLNRDAKTDNFKVRLSSETPPIVLSGSKFYDADTDGIWDPGEPGITGWRIEKVPPTPADVTYTGTIGAYGFIVLPNSGSYTISEVPPPPGFFPAGAWVNTTATSLSVNVGNTDISGLDFGNVCLGEGGGRTLGFWSNKVGERLFDSGDLALLVGLNLRDAAGNHFNPASYGQFRTWLLNATATNMAYMLSAQLAAMALNVNNGLVDGNSLIYAPGTSSANSAGFATVNAVMAEANGLLGTYGLVLSGHPQRAHMEALKNALDRGNNNLNFVQPRPCTFSTPY